MSEHGPIQVTYTKSGLPRYVIEVAHSGLNEYKPIRAKEKHICWQKAEAQMAKWDAKWERKMEQQRKCREREQRAQKKEEKKALAAQRTMEAQAELEQLRNLLAATLDVDDAVDWSILKDHSNYSEKQPRVPEFPPAPEAPVLPDEPDAGAFQPRLVLLDKLLSSRAERKQQEAKVAFQEAHAAWEKEVQHQQDEYDAAKLVHAQRIKSVKEKHERKLREWEEARAAFLEEQRRTNAEVDALKQTYALKDPDAVLEYCDLVLSNSDYPDYFPQSFEVDYNPENGILIVDYQLPGPDDLPTLEKVTYAQSRDEFNEKELAKTRAQKLYDNTLYQVALRTVHELFEADVIDALAAVVFNGYVRGVDPATGKERNPCVLSLQAGKEEFLEINLHHVDPKACFKKLSGVGSSKLHSVTPVAPIAQIDRDDTRFTTSYDVAERVEGENLAAVDWEDFEHLIRELFEEEFSETGGEVKVTRASRDGGIDAVIFDPDPLRGGKIVVQAKRYTNTVGVSAVRDLYGTVMNEGANKGILVTTSDYGPDAYAFARNKPISLLNGGNLIHLLNKHGHNARIDIEEARRSR